MNMYADGTAIKDVHATDIGDGECIHVILSREQDLQYCNVSGALRATEFSRADIVHYPNEAPICYMEGQRGPSISISYSGEWTAVAIGGQRGLGIDIEIRRSLCAPLMDLAQQICCDRELKILDALKSEQQSAEEFFFKCWTRKEAIGKAMGVGLVSDLTEIDSGTLPVVAYANLRETDWIRTDIPDDRAIWVTEIIPLPAGLVGSVATVGKPGFVRTTDKGACRTADGVKKKPANRRGDWKRARVDKSVD